MIGIVIVSHSARLAEGVRELAGQMSRGAVRIACAGGTSDADNPLGTDAYRVLEAIESVYSPDGVIVLMDLGSAVLSAETALELLDEKKRLRVRLAPAALVEGAVAAASQAAAGAGLDEILREVRHALQGKAAQLGCEAAAFPSEEPAVGPATETTVTVPNRLGLHARPAARVVRLVRRYRAAVTLENETRLRGPADAGSMSGLLGLGIRQGHRVRVRARGPQAAEALAEVARWIAAGFGEADAAPEPAFAPASGGGAGGWMTGLPASGGIAIGPLIHLRRAAIEVVNERPTNPAAERQRLLTAVRGAREETLALLAWARANGGESQAGIFDAQLLMLEDPALVESASAEVLRGECGAAFAWQNAARGFAGNLAALEDPYMRARAADVTDVEVRVLQRLVPMPAALPGLTRPVIVAARDLAPSEVRDLDPALVRGLCLESGGSSAHSSILARSLGIPMVAGLGPGLGTIVEGAQVALDGETGSVWVNPDAATAAALEAKRLRWQAARKAAWARMHQPACTRDGRRMRVLANVSSVEEAAAALERGAEGVGVLRTEFLFLGRSEAPGEDEQVSAYLAIAEILGERPLIIRTLDVGADKSLQYIATAEEANPFLGLRGIRLMLGRREILRTQLRAILRAGARHRVDILLPMVSSLAEFRQARAVLEEAKAELGDSGSPYRGGAALGVMIEVPSAVAIADQLAREAGFFSIGTNDLVQYVMAADRTNPQVAALADPFQPAVLRLVHRAIQAGREAGIGVAVCGEFAADPMAAALLIGMGLEEFSVSALLIPDLKQSISRSSFAEGEMLVREAIALESADAVRRLVAGRV